MAEGERGLREKVRGSHGSREERTMRLWWRQDGAAPIFGRVDDEAVVACTDGWRDEGSKR
ncbi:hypothetical protein SESBI_34425 [Sesbania bispinosa]|nr:hypothetical protein SESBI_34425 [Sesbania bispinosa]